MAIIKHGVVRGSNITFNEKISLPEGTEVLVHIQPVNGAESPAPSSSQEDFMNQPCFGMWSDRQDMADSAGWVRKERQEWNRRLASEA